MNKQQFAAHCDRSVKWLEKAQADGLVTPIMRAGRCYYRPEWRDEVRARTKGNGGWEGDVPPHVLALREATRRQEAADRAALAATLSEVEAWRSKRRHDAERLEGEQQTLVTNEALRLAAFDEDHISEAAFLDRFGFAAAAERLRRGRRPSTEAESRGLEVVEKLVREGRLTPVARRERQWLAPGRPDLVYETPDRNRYFTKLEAREAEEWLEKHLPKTSEDRKLAVAAVETAAAQGKPDKVQEFFGNFLAMQTAPPERRAEYARRLIEDLLRPDP
jgi:hypothetical protein